MKAYKITTDQKLQIDKTAIAKNHLINLVEDINGDPFIFEIEMEYLATFDSTKARKERNSKGF